MLLDRWLWAIGIASAAAAFLGVSFWITLPAAGLIYVLASQGRLALAGRGRSVTAAVLAYVVGVEVGAACSMAPWHRIRQRSVPVRPTMRAWRLCSFQD